MSLSTLREAARRELTRLSPVVSGARGDVDRVTVDVVHGGEREMVSFRLRGAEVSWSCSCGGVDCEHAIVGMKLLSGEAPDAERMSETPEGVAFPSDARGLSLTERPLPADRVGLTEALSDVVTAVVRTGVAATAAPSVFESLQRLVAAAPDPLPLGVSRWVGRMHLALAEQNVELVARMLDGATRLVDDLRQGESTDESHARITCWLGASPSERASVTALSDRVMIELGRELLDGATRAGIERRHLLDVATGKIYREERMRGNLSSSLGTCPRVIHVGLAEVERGTAPERIRLLQYASSPHVPSFRWQEAAAWATPNFASLAATYREAMAQFPGVAEPVGLIAVSGMEYREDPVVIDEAGRRLPLFGGQPGNLSALQQLLGDSKVRFVYGRLLDRADVIHLRPIACGVMREGEQFEHIRI